MKPRQPEGRPRIYGVRGTHPPYNGVVMQVGTFYEARNALLPNEVVVVSYDDGVTWNLVGESPESEDPRKR